MDNNELNNIFLKIQDLYFKKSSEEQINDFLMSKNISIESLIQKFEIIDIKEEYKLENILKIIELLITYPTYKKSLYSTIISKQEIILNIKISKIAIFIVNFIRMNSKFFVEEKDFLNKLLSVYIFDENAGNYEHARNLMILLINNNNFEQNFIDLHSLIDKLEKSNKNSIMLVRGIEIILMIMDSDEKNITDYLKSNLNLILRHSVFNVERFL